MSNGFIGFIYILIGFAELVIGQEVLGCSLLIIGNMWLVYHAFENRDQ